MFGIQHNNMSLARYTTRQLEVVPHAINRRRPAGEHRQPHTVSAASYISADYNHCRRADYGPCFTTRHGTLPDFLLAKREPPHLKGATTRPLLGISIEYSNPGGLWVRHT